MLARTRLFRIIDKGRRHPVVWISGPAGSGKTTLVGNYLDVHKLPCLWYQVDAGDADIASFFYYLGQAAQKAAPRYRKPLPLLTPEYLPGITTFTQRFFENLYARFKPPFAIVFDNYQEASEQSPLHNLVNIGLSLIPEGIRIFVVSRNQPPPPLMRLRANNAMNAVGWDELRFTQEESKQFVQRKEKKKLTEVALEQLHKRSEGWAAGLVLLLEDAGTKTQGLPATAKPAQGEVFNYFAGEVFGKLDSETREFLLMTSFLPTMTVRMADNMTDQGNAGRILAGLNRHHFFTEKHQTAEPSYQYHALFRDFLLTKMKESLNPEGLCRVQNRAAGILEEAGQVEDSASIYQEAQNWEKYIPLILSQAQALVMQGRSATLSEWIAAVPKEIRETVPWFQYWTGACKMPFNPVESQRYFEHAFEMFKKSDDLPGQFLAWSGIADSIYLAGFDYALLDPWFDALDKLLLAHPDFPSPEIEVLVSNSVFGALLYRRPEQARLVFWEKRMDKLIPTIVDDRLRITAGSFLLNYYIWIGDAKKASKLLDMLQSKTRAHEVTPLALILLNIIEAIYYWQETVDFESCHESVAKGLKTAKTTGIHLLDNLLISNSVYSALSSGDVATGAVFLGQMKSMLGQARRFDAAHYHYLAAWEAALRDDLAGAFELTQTSLSLAESVGMPFPRALAHIAMAQVLTAQKKYLEASRHIGMARRINQDMKSTLLEIMCLLPEALLALEQNDEMKCRSLLQAAFALWKKHVFLNFSWWLPREMARHCAKALEAGIEVEFVQGIIRKRHLQPDASLSVGENWPWPLKIYTLGEFKLIVNDKPARFSGKVQKKPLEMLKALIALGGSANEEQVIDALWPDAAGDAGRQSFKTNLHRLRHLIGNENALAYQEGRLSLDPRHCWVDVWAFEKAGLSAGGNQQSEMPRLEKAAEMYKGHFLADDAEKPWTVSMRERLKVKFVKTIRALGEQWERENEYGKAAALYERALELDDLAEELYQGLISCHWALGRRAHASRVFERCRSNLAAAFGVGPSEETEALFRKIREY